MTHTLALLHPCAAHFESCVAPTHFTHRTRTCLEHYAHTNVDFPLTSTHSCYTRMSRTHLSTFMLPSQGHCLHSNSVVSRTCLSQHHTRSQSAALIPLVELYTCISHKHFTRISLTSLRKHLLADLLHSVSYVAYANHASPVTPANCYTDTHRSRHMCTKLMRRTHPCSTHIAHMHMSVLGHLLHLLHTET